MDGKRQQGPLRYAPDEKLEGGARLGLDGLTLAPSGALAGI
jgi:hypothetical protein